MGYDNKFTLLHSVLELLKLKARNRWSDKSFTDLLVLLKDMLPKENKLPCNIYRAKKFIAPLALDVQKVHACPNHYVLYRKEYVHYDRCPVCKRSRYKRNDDHEDEDDSVEVEDTTSNARKKRKNPAMVMWYLPVIGCLKRLFLNPRDSELMSWHFEQAQNKTDEMHRHPSDASKWRNIDT